MPDDATEQSLPSKRRLIRWAAYGVHLYTALGIAAAFLAAREICAPETDARWVFVWLLIAGAIDVTDGPLARLFRVKRNAPQIDGRRMDDIIDYITWTFLPLLLVWRMGWLPEPAEVWIIIALVASAFGFSNVTAKAERAGLFRGFPSYWNVVAFYLGIWHHLGYPPYFGAAGVVLCALLTVLPVWFLYPNLAPPPWKLPLLVGGAAWLLFLLWMLPIYPAAPAWALWVSLIYPAFYTVLSIALSRRALLVEAPKET